MIMPYHFVCLQIPALDHLIFTTGEQVGLAGGDGQAPDGGDVACKGQTEGSRREVPDLDRAVAGSGSEPLVVGLDGQGAHPA